MHIYRNRILFLDENEETPTTDPITPTPENEPVLPPTSVPDNADTGRNGDDDTLVDPDDDYPLIEPDDDYPFIDPDEDYTPPTPIIAVPGAPNGDPSGGEPEYRPIDPDEPYTPASTVTPGVISPTPEEKEPGVVEPNTARKRLGFWNMDDVEEPDGLPDGVEQPPMPRGVDAEGNADPEGVTEPHREVVSSVDDNEIDAELHAVQDAFWY